jgi:hypothetical protein
MWRLRAEGERVFAEIQKDIEARCRGYVEYAAQQCQVPDTSMNIKTILEGNATCRIHRVTKHIKQNFVSHDSPQNRFFVVIL